MTKEEYIEEIVKISSLKEKYLREFLYLSEKQTNYIVSEDITEIEKIIKKKQKRIELIDKLDGEFEKYFDKLKDEYKLEKIGDLINKLTEKDYAMHNELKILKDTVTKIHELLSNIAIIEKKVNELMGKMKKKFESEIKMVNVNKKINNAYNQSRTNRPPSYFIDKKK